LASFGQKLANSGKKAAMKRIILISVLLVVINFVTIAREVICTGKTHTQMGDYKIEIADSTMLLKGKALETFIISYQNSKMEVLIVFEKQRRCMNYYVLSDSLSIKYVCNGDFFGVTKLGKELDEDGYTTSESALNREQYFHQKVITQRGYSKMDYTRLVAAYFPMLLRNSKSNISVL